MESDHQVEIRSLGRGGTPSPPMLTHSHATDSIIASLGLFICCDQCGTHTLACENPCCPFCSLVLHFSLQCIQEEGAGSSTSFLRAWKSLFWGHSALNATHTAVLSPTSSGSPTAQFTFERGLEWQRWSWNYRGFPWDPEKGSRLRKSSPQNTRSTFAQTRLSLMAEIRVALSSLVSIATQWLLLWEKGFDEMAEGKKESESTEVVQTRDRPRFAIHLSLTVFRCSLVTSSEFLQKQKRIVFQISYRSHHSQTHVFQMHYCRMRFQFKHVFMAAVSTDMMSFLWEHQIFIQMGVWMTGML